MPLYELIAQAVRSSVATTVFMVLMTVVAFLTLIGSTPSASRITWSFARDEALIFSKFIKKIDQKQGVPIDALYFQRILDRRYWVHLPGVYYR